MQRARRKVAMLGSAPFSAKSNISRARRALSVPPLRLLSICILHPSFCTLEPYRRRRLERFVSISIVLGYNMGSIA